LVTDTKLTIPAIINDGGVLKKIYSVHGDYDADEHVIDKTTSYTNIIFDSGIKTCSDMILEYYDSESDDYEQLVKNVVFNEGFSVIGDHSYACACVQITNTSLARTIYEIGVSAFVFTECIENLIFNDSITKLGTGAFGEVWNLRSVTLSGGLREVPNGCFFDCTDLQEVNFKYGLETIGGGAFSWCQISEIVLPDSMRVLDDSSSYDSWEGGCFEGQQIDGSPVNVSLTLNNGLEYIGVRAFASTCIVNEVSIPKNVQSIDAWAFGGDLYWDGYGALVFSSMDHFMTCVQNGYETDGASPGWIFEFVDLRHVYIGENSIHEVVTNNFVWPSKFTVITPIFAYCDSLETLTIPVGVSEIADSAFYDCVNLTTIIYEGTAEQWQNVQIGDNAFDFCGIGEDAEGEQITKVICSGGVEVDLPANAYEIQE